MNRRFSQLIRHLRFRRDPFEDSRAEWEHQTTPNTDHTDHASDRSDHGDHARDHGDHNPGLEREPNLVGVGNARGHLHGHTHGHTHDHRPPTPASRRVRRGIAMALVPLAIATLVGLVALWPKHDPRYSTDLGQAEQRLNDLTNATVTGVDLATCTGLDAELNSVCIQVEAKLTERDPGRTISFISSTGNGSPRIRIGDPIVVVEVQKPTGDSPGLFSFYGFPRKTPLLLLLAMFVGLALVIGRRNGLRALVGLSFTIFLLLKFALPAITNGRSPLLVSVVAAAAIMLVTLYASHGPNARTSCAVVGTLSSLLITGALAQVFTQAARFTGIGNEDVSYLRAIAPSIDAQGLLLAGIIIGALGVLDDVTVTQASAVWELHQADKTLSFRRLYSSAMRIGRDHLASTVNTLVLAYAGAALPLLLLFSNAGVSWREVVLEESVASEIVRTLVGSIGLMASVPITTALTALVVARDH
jgi:uncharacterized membrane protein